MSGDPHLGSTRLLFLTLYFQQSIMEFNLIRDVATQPVASLMQDNIP